MLIAFAALLTVTTVFAWINDRWIKAPATVAVTVAGALSSVSLLLLDALGVDLGLRAEFAKLLTQLDFTSFLLGGVLSILLFAGSLELDAAEMVRQKAPILILAIGSTLVSTALIGVTAYGVFSLLGMGIPFIWAMLFGALISPTDPVAVLDLLKRAKVPRKIETLISGEALFNDGVGVVVFLAVGSVAGLSLGVDAEPTLTGAGLLFLQEAGGGLAFGAVLGVLGVLALKPLTNHSVEVLVTLTLVLGGYAVATQIGVSGPLAMVVAGLIVSAKKHEVFEHDTEGLVEGFWGMLDQVANILLFAFIGLDVLLTPTAPRDLVAGALLIVIALVARFISIAIPLHVLRERVGYAAFTNRLLTWGGLRGGIAISLALGLPAHPARNPIVTVTYCIVLFSIVVQGMTIMPLVHKAVAADKALEEQRAARA